VNEFNNDFKLILKKTNISIVSSIECGIDQLPDAEKDFIRASVTSASTIGILLHEKALRDLTKDICYNFTSR